MENDKEPEWGSAEYYGLIQTDDEHIVHNNKHGDCGCGCGGCGDGDGCIEREGL